MSRLIILSGLPGTGKTTLARRVATKLGAVHLRVDTIEQALRDLCSLDVEGEGYRLAYRLAADNLRLGNTVIADCCKPIELTRREWDTIARDAKARPVHVLIECTNITEHRARAELRITDIRGLTLPTWKQICEREWDPWSTPGIRLDTAGKTADESFTELLNALQTS